MRMTLVFVVFALVSGLASRLFWHLAPGLGIDMMLVYLALAVLSALVGLVSRPARSPARSDDGKG
jgi:TRAP-type C4-dicarboxylate transport system permease small subunit